MCWGLLIFFRLIHLQIVQHSHYIHLAQQQQERNIELQAARGAIFDRNGQPLAMSVGVDSVCVNPLRIPDLHVAADLLARVLDLDGNELLGKLAAAVENKRGFMWVKRKVSMDEASKLRSYNLDWVEFRTESSRFYPKGPLAAHVLGGVGHDEHGNGGIEQYLDKELRGKPGIMRTTADVRQNVFDLKVFSDPVPGSSLTLTIDERIQYIAERELANAVKEHGASTGSIVAMDPRTGDVLALANFPTFDPNEAPETKADFEARKNLAVTAPFEPGSVFKVITLSSALETTRLTPTSSFFCYNGAFTVFRHTIHDTHSYGTLSMADILAKSSNIGAIQIALQMGKDNFQRYIRSFGFGSRTGLPLPGESSGVVRRNWQPTSIYSIAMGHEVLTTTLQLAQACTVIASGGSLVKPRLVLRSERKGDGTVRVPAPEMKQILRPETAMKMRMMMRGVVEYGTGKAARLKGYSSAGKTGSAQLYDRAARAYVRRYNGSFMGFAPVNNPSIVVVVSLNNTRTGTQGYGGVVSAPVFNKVTTAALRILDVPRDLPDEVDPTLDPVVPESDLASADLSVPPDPEGEAELMLANATMVGPELPPSIVATGPKVPDFKGKTKRQVLAQAMESAIRVELAGAGVARYQQPRPGSVMRPGERVRVVFTR